ncbi:hypothetical protein VTO42DRAFT_8616 [Malbranchea cinnamomea]
MWAHSLCRPCLRRLLRPIVECHFPSRPLSAQGKRTFHFSRPAHYSDDFKSSEGKTPAGDPKIAGKADLQYDHEKVQHEFASLLEQFGLADIPEPANQQGQGVEINSGQIVITDQKLSKQRHKTLLLLWPAMRSLSRRDFQRLERKGKHIQGWRVGGLEEVIPVRSRLNLQYQDGWILIFASPADAYEFQSRASILRDLARQAMPKTPTSGIQPPRNFPDFSDPKIEGFTIRDYTLSTPWQTANLFAYLHPFPQSLQRYIDLHRTIISSDHKGWEVFPVLVWVDQQHELALDPQLLEYLIHEDGNSRGARWQLVDSDDAITRVTGRLRHELLDSGKEPRAQLGTRPVDALRVLFSSESEARRFVRTWHRTPVPRHVFVTFRGGPRPLIKAECLFHTDGY